MLFHLELEHQVNPLANKLSAFLLQDHHSDCRVEAAGSAAAAAEVTLEVTANENGISPLCAAAKAQPTRSRYQSVLPAFSWAT